MRRQELWYDTHIPGFAARMAHLSLDEINMNRAEEWRGDAQLFQFTHPDEIRELMTDVYQYWVKPKDADNHMFIDNMPGLIEVRNRVAMVMQQLVHTTEIGVTLDRDQQAVIETYTLRARLALEMSRDLHNGPDFAECRHCGGWFPIKRRGAVYCSGRCQTAWWRANKED